MSEPSLGVAVPATRLHPIYLVIGTATTLRQAIPFLVVTIFGGAPLNVQSPGDGRGSAVTLECLSGRRLDELRIALESGDPATGPTHPRPRHDQGRGTATIQRYLDWRRTSVASAPGHERQVIAVLTTAEILIAAVTDSSISLILVAVLVVWSRFSAYVPARASEFMNEIVEPQGAVAVVVTLVAVAIAADVVLGALRLNRFTLVRRRRVVNRNTVIAHRGGSPLTELSSSPWKARAGVAGFTMRFSSGRGAGIRYMEDSDALLLLHTVGRAWQGGTERRRSTNQPSEATTSW